MLVQKYSHWIIDTKGICTVRAGASGSSGTPATEQMLAQQHVWRRSQLATPSAANQAGHISYTGRPEKKQA